MNECGHCEHFPPQTCFLEPPETKIQAIRRKCMKKQWYFSQNQKGFGCICAVVLLILSLKKLIWQKTRQSTLAITATVLLKIIMAENGGNSGSDSQSWLPRFLSYQLFKRQNKQHCRANTTKSFLVLEKIYIYDLPLNIVRFTYLL